MSTDSWLHIQLFFADKQDTNAFLGVFLGNNVYVA